MDGGFDVVVGNPPYVRQELIPDALIAEYRRRYATVYDRADIYIPFMERSLGLLAEGGVLGFICADRWMKNRYGGPSVSSSLTAITCGPSSSGVTTQISRQPEISATALRRLADAPRSGSASPLVRQSPVVARGAEPWIVDGGSDITLVRDLEARLPTLEEAGCKVGIGVATGADRAFMAHDLLVGHAVPVGRGHESSPQPRAARSARAASR